jgi:hypothetical protein
MREITEDFIEDMIHVACAPRGMLLLEAANVGLTLSCFSIQCPKHFRKHYIRF